MPAAGYPTAKTIISFSRNQVRAEETWLMCSARQLRGLPVRLVSRAAVHQSGESVGTKAKEP
jgi:hypothetical protein